MQARKPSRLKRIRFLQNQLCATKLCENREGSTKSLSQQRPRPASSTVSRSRANMLGQQEHAREARAPTKLGSLKCPGAGIHPAWHMRQVCPVLPLQLSCHPKLWLHITRHDTSCLRASMRIPPTLTEMHPPRN